MWALGKAGIFVCFVHSYISSIWNIAQLIVSAQQRLLNEQMNGFIFPPRDLSSDFQLIQHMH